jgi:hypothetical protein
MGQGLTAIDENKEKELEAYVPEDHEKDCEHFSTKTEIRIIRRKTVNKKEMNQLNHVRTEHKISNI